MNDGPNHDLQGNMVTLSKQFHCPEAKAARSKSRIWLCRSEQAGNPFCEPVGRAATSWGYGILMLNVPFSSEQLP